jgi:hypothetical protein
MRVDPFTTFNHGLNNSLEIRRGDASAKEVSADPGTPACAVMSRARQRRHSAPLKLLNALLYGGLGQKARSSGAGLKSRSLKLRAVEKAGGYSTQPPSPPTP